MKPSIRLAVFLPAMLFAAGIFAYASTQHPDEAASGTTAPIAYVYVTNITNPNNPYVSNYDVYAFAAAANGKLTPVPGSPFKDNIYSSLAVNSKYLFGGEDNGLLVTFEIEANGALKKVETTNPAAYSGGGVCSGGVLPKVDHSGSFVYNFVQDKDCTGDYIQLYSIQSSTGKLTYEGQSAELLPVSYALSFSGNNTHAFAPVYCQNLAPNEIASLFGFQRLSDGKLNLLYHQNMASSGAPGLGPVPPTEPGGGNSYCPLALAPDPANHMAALLTDTNNDGSVYGNPAIATYTIGANGALSTASTSENMPMISSSIYNEDTSALSMRMSPSGKILAVGGELGLEIFHFNGTGQATEFETLFPNEFIDALYWDNNNHLYVLYGSVKSGLHVLTVTPTSITEAPGSPYPIPDPATMIVQSR